MKYRMSVRRPCMRYRATVNDVKDICALRPRKLLQTENVHEVFGKLVEESKNWNASR